jgi:hypothetical protein
MSLGMRRPLAWLLPFFVRDANRGNSLKFQHDASMRVAAREQHRVRGYKFDIAASADSC